MSKYVIIDCGEKIHLKRSGEIFGPFTVIASNEDGDLLAFCGDPKTDIVGNVVKDQDIPNGTKVKQKIVYEYQT